MVLIMIALAYRISAAVRWCVILLMDTHRPILSLPGIYLGVILPPQSQISIYSLCPRLHSEAPEAEPVAQVFFIQRAACRRELNSALNPVLRRDKFSQIKRSCIILRTSR